MLRPINDNLIVKRQLKKLKSKIIFIPESSDVPKQDTCLGIVIAVGDEVKLFKPDEYVLYSVEAGIKHLEDPSLLFIKEKDCLLKVEKEKEDDEINVIQ